MGLPINETLALPLSQIFTSIMVLVVSGIFVTYHFKRSTVFCKIMDYAAWVLMGLTQFFWAYSFGIMADNGVLLVKSSNYGANDFTMVSGAILGVLVIAMLVDDLVRLGKRGRNGF